MARFRVLIALLLCASAASAQPLQSVIERPLTLPRGTVDLALQGTYSNWANGPAGTVPATLAGESLALGIDFGATDQAQLGLAVSFPINPGAGFGSILASAAVAAGRSVALRVDAGFENFGFNGDNTQGFEHVNATSAVSARASGHRSRPRSPSSWAGPTRCSSASSPTSATAEPASTPAAPSSRRGPRTSW